MGLNQAYLTNNNFVAQINQRKSRGKPSAVNSVEPTSIVAGGPLDANSLGNKKSGSNVGSPNPIQTTYNGASSGH